MKPELTRFRPEFLERVKKIIPPGLIHETWQGFSQQRPTTFRINTLKGNGKDVLDDLKSQGILTEEAPGFDQAYLIKKGSQKKMRESDSYQKGKLYLQSLSSQIPPMVLKPCAGERVLDMAAAPGGKTAQMGALMRNEGEIIAIEPHPIRYEKLTHTLNLQGIVIARPLKMRGQEISRREEKLFDKILVDVPCSSEGTFYAHDPKSYAHWSLDLIRELSRQQKKLMESAIQCLKPQGSLVYSTCALAPEENEEVIQWALDQYPTMECKEIPLKFPFLKSALPSWEKIKFNPQVAKCRRIYPSRTMEGFFICLLKKKG